MLKVRSAALAALLCASGLPAQVPPAERLGGEGITEGDPAYYEENYYLSGDSPYAPPSAGDSDLGEQVLLRRQPKWAPVQFRADTFLFWSNNVASVAEGEDDGWYAGGSVSARWKQRLRPNLFLDTYAYQDAYIYDSDGLDFQSSEFGLGLIANLPALDDLALFGRYEFLYIHSENPLFGPLDSDDYVNSRYHRLRFGGYKALFANAAHSVILSADGRWDFDASSGAQRRQQVSARLAYTWAATDRLSLTVSYRASYRDYLASSREDWNQYVGLEATCRLTDWAELYGSILYGVNDSNQPDAANDYEALQSGMGVGLRARF